MVYEFYIYNSLFGGTDKPICTFGTPDYDFFESYAFAMNVGSRYYEYYGIRRIS